jgi:hypothetical protein
MAEDGNFIVMENEKKLFFLKGEWVFCGILKRNTMILYPSKLPS